ncbi:hypothetical protein YC2023_108005 [Brassica napus]
MSRHSTGESSLDRRVLSRPFCSHLTVLSPQDCSVITSRDESSLDRRVFSRSRLARSLAATHSLSRSRCSDLFLAVTRLATLAVTRLALLRSLDSRSLNSHSCGHSTRTLAVTRSSTLPVTRLTLLRSLAVALLRSLNLLFAVTRLALSQSLGSDRSLAVTRIARKSRA